MNDSVKTMGIIGGSGFLGLNLVGFFSKKNFKVFSIDKENYENSLNKHFDILINANGNSKKFWANQNPKEDYKLSVESVKRSLVDFKFNVYVYISSSDVYPEHNSSVFTQENSEINRSKLPTYGLHKLLAEDEVVKLNNFLILRCSAMIGKNLKKGVIKDIMDGKGIYITQDSKLQFITAQEIGRAIFELIEKNVKNKIFNCGGIGSVSVREMFELFKKTVSELNGAEKQEYEMNTQLLNNLIGFKTSKEYLQEFIFDNLR